MTARRIPLWARGSFVVGLGVLATGVFVAALALSVTIRRGAAIDVLYLLLGVSFCLTGGLITFKRPENSIGWIMWAAGFLLLLQALAYFYGLSARVGGVPFSGLADEAAWVQMWLWIPGFYLIAMVLFLFPDGRPPDRRWRWVLWLGAVVQAALIVAVAEVWPRRSIEFVGAEGLIGEVSGSPLLDVIANSGLIVLVLIALSALVYRFIRSERVVRQQLKWLMWAAGTTWIASLAVALASPGLPIDNSLYVGLLFVAVISIPISTAIAVLKYRLYEIDRIISRTVTYALVVGLLVLAIFGLVTAMALFVPSDDPVVVAVATLVAFALFNPIRSRVQRLVDRRFNRSRYDAARVIDDFTGSLREQVDTDGVVDNWVGVVEKTMQPAAVGVWVKQEKGEGFDPTTSAPQRSRPG